MICILEIKRASPSLWRIRYLAKTPQPQVFEKYLTTRPCYFWQEDFHRKQIDPYLRDWLWAVEAIAFQLRIT